MLHQTRIGRLAGTHQLGHVLQEVVDAFELVVVHGVVLGELELLETHVLLGHETGHVQRAEQPATAGTILMGGGAIVDNGGKPALHQAGAVIVARHLVNARRGDRVHGHTVVVAGFKILNQCRQCISAQRRDISHCSVPPVLPRPGHYSAVRRRQHPHRRSLPVHQQQFRHSRRAIPPEFQLQLRTHAVRRRWN